MKHSKFLAHIVLAACAIALGSPCFAQDLEPNIRSALGQLEAGFTTGDGDAFRAALADPAIGVQGDTLGHLMFARSHFDKAAWFFGTDALGDLNDPASLNNFSAMLVQTHADKPDIHPVNWLAVAHEASRHAVKLAPDVAAYHNNLGQVARRLGLYDEATAALERALQLAPGEPLYWTNLARILEAMGNTKGATLALAEAYKLEPAGVPFLFARADLPGASAALPEAAKPNCNVNFRCQEICPRSIIGGLMSVTCEMENASAQMACAEGKPYPTSYDCREDLPEYGILIPGLNSGFSIVIPGGSVHVVVDGQGNVDVRGEIGASAGPIGGYLRADGHYSPDGGVSVDNTGGGVRVSIFNKTPAAEAAKALGHPPAHIEVEKMTGKPSQINLETYNAGIISY